MKKTFFFLIIISLAKTIGAQDATTIYKNTVGSTVTIETDIMIGSGFFIDENIIATNYHVIEGAKEVHCYTNNSSQKYKIDGYFAVEKSIDLIILKVPDLNRPALKIAKDLISPGQKIYVIGSPKGLPASISDGIIAGLRDLEGYKLIQITAPISPGSSGGPVLNENGELIGVSVGQYEDGQNLNFAIPISNLEKLLNAKANNSIPIISLYNKIDYFIDSRDGKKYETVKVGTQSWMAENLNYEIQNSSWCYKNDPKNCQVFGRLYTWQTAINACPAGWHLPSKIEWSTLIEFLGGQNVAGPKIKSKSGWGKDSSDSTDESQLTFLPGGYRWYEDGSFVHIGWHGIWWSSTTTEQGPVAFDLYDYSPAAFLGYSGSELENSGYSVRCIKDYK